MSMQTDRIREGYEQDFRLSLEELSNAEFSYTVNLASGTAMMKSIIRKTQAYQWLMECLDYDLEGYTDRIAFELHRLSHLPFDRAFANPFDENMTALALIFRDVGFKREDFAEFLRNASHCFWLNRV